MSGRIVKKMFAKLGRPFGANRRKKAARFKLGDCRKVLVYKPDHLGDVMLAAPAIYSLRKAMPDAHIVFAGSPSGCDLIKSLDLVNETTVFHSPSVWGVSLGRVCGQTLGVRTRRLDLVVNFRHDYRDILIASSLGGQYFATYDHEGLAVAATHLVDPPSDDCYEQENHLRLVEALGAVPVVFMPPIRDEALQKAKDILKQGRFVVCHPVARTSAKQWPLSKFTKLAIALEKDGIGTLCVGGKEDQQACEQILQGTKLGKNLAGRMDFSSLFALLKRSDAFVGIDSFVMHAAYATGLKGVAIFSGTNIVKRWAPPGMMVCAHPVDCAPCAQETCNVTGHPCLENVSVEAVLDSLNDVLEEGNE